MIHLEIKAPKFSRTGLARLGAYFRERVQRLAMEATGYAKAPQKRRPLQVRTGKLMASITRIFRQRGAVIEAGVASSHPAAGALEYGGTRAAHRIEARAGQALRFTIGGQVLYRRYAEIPPVILPPHPFLTPSVRRAGRTLRSDVRAELKRVVSGVMGRG
jgi:hypothetical protein